MELKPNQMRKLVDEKLDISEVLSRINPDEFYQAGQNCFCPFHDNQDTPSAAIYDNEGIVKLWCFSEKKLYGSSDALELLAKKNIFAIADKIWNAMSEGDRHLWLNDHAYADYGSLFSTNSNQDDEKPLNKELEAKKRSFKTGKISVSELVSYLIDTNKKS